jgi:hypothetical protein
MRALPLAEHGLEWAWSPAAIAHPLDDGTAATLELSLDATAAGLGEDAPAYRTLMKPFAEHAGQLFDEIQRRYKVERAQFHLLAYGPSSAPAFGVSAVMPERIRSLWLLPGFPVGIKDEGLARMKPMKVATMATRPKSSGLSSRTRMMVLVRLRISLPTCAATVTAPLETARNLIPSRRWSVEK